jgi:cytochrome c oxidase cbb3-type subunit I/II
VSHAEGDARDEALKIANGLREQGVSDAKLEEKEIVALIAYLQRMGADWAAAKKGVSQ